MLSRAALRQKKRNVRSVKSERFRILREKQRSEGRGTGDREIVGGLGREGGEGEGRVIGGEVEGEGRLGEGEAMSESEFNSDFSLENDTNSDTDPQYETPPKKRKLDSEFVLDTPDRRSLAELPSASNGAYLGQTSQLQAFVDQINATSKCATEGCNGVLAPVSITLRGLGGSVEVQYDCTGCVERRVQFSSSASHEASQQTVLGLTLQVAFIASGCNYAQYQKVLASALGMHAVTPGQFYNTLKKMQPHVKALLDEQCEAAKEAMKAIPVSELGSYKNAVTIADGTWMTRGFHSQNFTFQIRHYMNGALLYYIHLCQRGKDVLCEGELFEGTSKSAEGHAASILCGRAKEEGMILAVHWQDADSSSASSVREHFPKAKLMLCGGHGARAHQKILKGVQVKKSFTATEKRSLEKKYPDVNNARCKCPVRHHPGCGCISDKFIAVARSRYFRALVDAGTEPEKFAARMTALPHHVNNEHEQCDFHALKVCACEKNCDADDLNCPGKVYETRYRLTCPYHRLAYQIECDRRAGQAKDVIHPVLGKGHTNQSEASHNVLTLFRPKHWHLTRLHYHVSTNLGLLQANMTYMNSTRSLDYHWLPELLQRMCLPVLDGVEAVLKQANKMRAVKLEKRKTEAVKRKRNQWKSQHRGAEQDARKKWGKSQKIQHTYNDKAVECLSEPPLKMASDPISTPTRSTRKRARSCVCGATTHSRTSHKDCPRNKANKAGFGGDKIPIVSASRNRELSSLPSDDESIYEEIEGYMESDVFISSTDEDEDDNTAWCMCEGRAHTRQCPLNPRNRGAAASHSSPSKVTVMQSHSSQPDDTPQSKCSFDALVDSEGLACLGTTRSMYELSGPLPTPEWKLSVGEVLKKLSGLPLITTSEPDNEIACSEISPHVRDTIVPDGNCLFRALSKEVTGTQKNHRAVRLSIIAFMLEPLNAIEFAGFLFDTAPDSEDSPLCLITSYLERSKMRSNSAWGSDKEIRVAATLFQSDILVFSTSGSKRDWLRLRPLFRNRHCESLPAAGIKLHLYHTRSEDHYDRVVPRLTDLTVASEPPRCNCGSEGRKHNRTCPMNPRNLC